MSLLKSVIEKFVTKKQKSTVDVNADIQKYNGIDMSSLIVFAPKNVDELNKVIDCVNGGQAVIINFAGIKHAQAQSASDYLSGALYAIKAKISRLQNQLYIIMPKTMKLATL